MKRRSDEEISAPLYEYDAAVRAQYGCFAGVDEAGRGPLCGPVCVAACILDPENPVQGINDSKKLTEKKRDALFDEIKEKALAYRIVFVGPDIIDRDNILNATMGGMKQAVEELEHELKILLLPKDPNDNKNVIVEIRAGAGGDEAALFAAEIYRMYVKYAESRRWKTEMMSLNENGIGGFKEVTFMINGAGAYSRLKYESGVHRVQRVPETESGGRVHTSTATVAVLPEMEEAEVEIRPEDIEMQVFRSSGAGGQHINKTSSAVRLIHKPSGIVVSCQEERSQVQNRARCMQMLASKLYEIEQSRIENEVSSERRSQVGTGMRNERIRTYNFPQGRVTDHRIGLTLYKIDAIMDGDLDELIDALVTADQAKKLQTQQE